MRLVSAPSPQSTLALDAVLRGDEAAVRSWLERGGRANTAREAQDEDGEVVTGVTLLMSAAQEGHERVVDLLLQHGAEINLQSSEGGTALMGAAVKNHERVVKLMLEHGAEINLGAWQKRGKDRGSHSPSHRQRPQLSHPS